MLVPTAFAPCQCRSYACRPVNAPVFDDIVRTDAKVARHDEGRFEFLNRTASRYFGMCRDLVEEWFSHVPVDHQAGLRGNLRSDLHHRSAFWELYLHEAYRRSGYTVEIHPDVPGRSTHPDFLLSRGGDRFYLEAVTVGQSPAERAEEARLSRVHQLLAETLSRGLLDRAVDLLRRPAAARDTGPAPSPPRVDRWARRRCRGR